MVSYKFAKPKPFRHQLLAIKRGAREGNKHLALFMEPRCGKTRTTIDLAGVWSLRDGVKKMVIVAPSTVMNVWAQELKKFSPLSTHITIWDAQERKRGLPVPSGPYDLFIVIVNYEAFAVPGKKLSSGRRSSTTGRFKVRADLRKWIGGDQAIGVLDESHKIKSPSGKASTLIVSMRNDFSHHLILTGTPVTKANRAHDLYTQYKYLNPARFADLPTALDFKQRYGRWISGNGYDQYIGERNMDEYRERLHEDAFVVKREDCFDLPEQEDLIVDIKLGPTTRRLYTEMATEMITTWQIEESLKIKANKKRTLCLQRYEETQDKRYLAKASEFKAEAQEHTIEASIKLVQSLRLAQITSGCATTDEGEVIRVGKEKLEALESIIDMRNEQDQKIVVAARFKADLDAIALLGRRFNIPVFQLRGGIDRNQRTENIEQFRRSETCSLFVMQPQSGSLGIDLSTARHMVWFSLVPSFVDFSQSNDRIALSKKSRTYTYLLVPNSIDTVMYEALQSDKAVADYVTSKPERLLLPD